MKLTVKATVWWKLERKGSLAMLKLEYTQNRKHHSFRKRSHKRKPKRMTKRRQHAAETKGGKKKAIYNVDSASRNKDEKKKEIPIQIEQGEMASGVARKDSSQDSTTLRTKREEANEETEQTKPHTGTLQGSVAKKNTAK
jgi:hypothetical protein